MGQVSRADDAAAQQQVVCVPRHNRTVGNVEPVPRSNTLRSLGVFRTAAVEHARVEWLVVGRVHVEFPGRSRHAVLALAQLPGVVVANGVHALDDSRCPHAQIRRRPEEAPLRVCRPDVPAQAPDRLGQGFRFERVDTFAVLAPETLGTVPKCATCAWIASAGPHTQRIQRHGLRPELALDAPMPVAAGQMRDIAISRRVNQKTAVQAEPIAATEALKSCDLRALLHCADHGRKVEDLGPGFDQKLVPHLLDAFRVHRVAVPLHTRVERRRALACGANPAVLFQAPGPLVPNPAEVHLVRAEYDTDQL